IAAGPGRPNTLSITFAPPAGRQNVAARTASLAFGYNGSGSGGRGTPARPVRTSRPSPASGKHGRVVALVQQRSERPPFASTPVVWPVWSGSGIWLTHALPVQCASHAVPPHAWGFGGTPVGSPACAAHGVGPVSGSEVPVVSVPTSTATVVTGDVGVHVD